MDEINEREGDFALLDLWQPSSFAHLQDQTGSQLIEKWDELNYRIDDDEVFMEKYDVSNFWKCLSSLSFTDTTSSDYRPWQTLEASESSCEDTSSDSIEDLTITALEAETVNDDPWSDVHLQIPIEKSRKFRSWELFYDKTFKEPRTTYWSEGGPLAIDAALCLPDHSTDGSPGKKEIQSLNFSSLLVVSIPVTFVDHQLKISRVCLSSGWAGSHHCSSGENPNRVSDYALTEGVSRDIRWARLKGIIAGSRLDMMSELMNIVFKSFL